MTQYYEYPFEDFLRDYDELNERHAFEEASFMHALGIMRAYFRETYADEGEAIFKNMRFSLAVMYLVDHLQHFDHGDLSVFGSKRVGSLVSERLMQAIHMRLVAEPKISIMNQPDPKEIVALAEKL